MTFRYQADSGKGTKTRYNQAIGLYRKINDYNIKTRDEVFLALHQSTGEVRKVATDTALFTHYGGTIQQNQCQCRNSCSTSTAPKEPQEPQEQRAMESTNDEDKNDPCASPSQKRRRSDERNGPTTDSRCNECKVRG